MPTEIQRERLRADLDADHAALTDAEIDDAFARAEAQYATSAAVEACARVLCLQQLLAGAAKRADYSQNATSERSSQVFEHLLRLRALYMSALDAALGTAAQWASLRRREARVEEYPNA